MDELANGFPLETMLQKMGLGQTDRFIVSDMPPSAERAAELGLDEATLAKIGGGTPAMTTLIMNTPVDVLQAWTTKEMLENNAAILPKRFDDADFAFYGTLLQGTPEQRPRWKRSIDETEGLLGELVGFFRGQGARVVEITSQGYDSGYTGGAMCGVHIALQVPMTQHPQTLRESFMDLCDDLHADGMLDPIKS